MGVLAYLSEAAGVKDLYDVVEVASALGDLSLENIAFIAVFYGSHVAVALFAIKSALIWVLRRFGCSTPRLYYYFPALPWRMFLRVFMAFKGWQEDLFKLGQYSSGGFASVLSTLTSTYGKEKVPLGLPWFWGLSLYAFIGLNVSTHLQVIGMSGAGKSVWLKLLLSEWKNSAVVIDAKNGELSRDLAPYDKKRQWVILRPLDEQSTGRLNPFDCIDEAFKRGGMSEALRLAYRIGQAYIETPPHSKQPFFTDTSRGYFVGLLMFVYQSFPEDQRNLGTVRDLIIHGMRVFNPEGSVESTPEESFAVLHKLMMNSNEIIAGAAGPYINAGKETLGSLKATLQERTKSLDIPAVRRMFSGKTTRPIRELKTCDDYVLVFDAPVSSIRGELQGEVRLFTNLVMYTFEVIKEAKGKCLVTLDEFNAQGYNGVVEAALPVARSQSQILTILIQDLEGLQAAYPKTYRAFTGNSTATLWMSTAHPLNLSELHKTLGKKTIITKDKYTGKKIYREVNVAETDQLGRFLSPQKRNMIVTRAGARALRIKLDPHFLALPVWRYGADPDHKETLLRRIARYFFDRKVKQISEPETQELPNDELDQPINNNHEDTTNGELPTNIIAFPGCDDTKSDE